MGVKKSKNNFSSDSDFEKKLEGPLGRYMDEGVTKDLKDKYATQICRIIGEHKV